MSVLGSDADGNGGQTPFATTHWSVVLTAQGESPAADQALEKLCRTYWPPLYGFVRRQGYTPEEAQDLTQGFFALLLERKDLTSVRQEKGRLRSYFLAGIKNFLANDRRRAMAIKRGQRPLLIPLHGMRSEELAELSTTEGMSADRIYDRRWAMTLLDQVFARLRQECHSFGNARLFDRLSELLSDEPGRPSQKDVGQEFGMTENAVKQAFHRLRRRYRELLREEIAHTVARPDQIEDELRALIAALRA